MVAVGGASSVVQRAGEQQEEIRPAASILMFIKTRGAAQLTSVNSSCDVVVQVTGPPSATS